MGYAATVSPIDNQTDNEHHVEAPTILLVEDDDSLREALSDTLLLADFNVVGAPGAEAALKILAQRNDIALVVSDVNMDGMSGHDLLNEVRSRHAQVPVLLMTAFANVNDSVTAIRNGAVDYLVKPFPSAQLVKAVNKYAGRRGQVDDIEPIAEAPSSRRLMELARRVATSDSTVLITGESGSGKEVLARYIHQYSDRADKPFVAINCAAIPDNMLEAMLFGHEKGAYTGAHSSAPGKFEQANGGTLLLDEISEMPLALQAKLLRVLQEREVERLGGRKTISLDVRVVATSNRHLQQSVIDGDFREDLYYRLSVLPLQWQPLRDRIEDIVPLANRLLQIHAAKQRRTGVTFSVDARQALLRHAWPGNVRELDNVVQRALVMQPGHEIQPEDLGLVPPGDHLRSATQLEAPIMQAGASVATAPPRDAHEKLLGADLKKREFEIIVQNIKAAGGSRKLTAERLGLSARTLRYKIARLKEQGFDVNAAVKSLL